MNLMRNIYLSFIKQEAKRKLNTFKSLNFFQISEEVTNAIKHKNNVVALESTVITHGLPYPQNFEVAKSVEQIIKTEGAIPATIALINGNIRVGLNTLELKTLAQLNSQAEKTSIRDISTVLANQKMGGTTVAATMWIANKVGIKIFATGGIGGVHYGAENSFDVSADLMALSRIPIAVVCAGAKSILDISKTLEVLETNGVNVIVYNNENFFPGFYTPRTPYRAPFNTTSLDKISDILDLNDKLMLNFGTLIACPVPKRFANGSEIIENSINSALIELRNNKKIVGKDVTPFLLKKVNQISGSLASKINIALLKNNAKIAANLSNIHSKKLSQTVSLQSVCHFSTHFCQKHYNLKKQPKILCIGASVLDIEIFSNCLVQKNFDSFYPGAIHMRAGGVGRNHADALTKLGCHVNFISAIGNDYFANILLQKSEHINWSNVFKSFSTSTATSVGFNIKGNISHGFINILSKTNLFDDSEYIVVDGNLTIDTLNIIFQVAEIKNKKSVILVWFEPTNYLKMSKLFEKKMLWKKVSILSPNAKEFKYFCNHLDIELPDKALECIKSLSYYFSCNPTLVDRMFHGNLELIIISMDRLGCLALHKTDKTTKALHYLINPPVIDQSQIVSVSGAGDCFNSGFFYCHLNNFDILECFKNGNLCALESLLSIDAVPATINKKFLHT